MAQNLVSCKYHPGAELVEEYHAGDMVCSQCGLVVGDRVIDVGNEWRSFSNTEQQDRSRVGDAENPLLGGTDLSTGIQYTATSSAGYDSSTGKQLYRTHKQMSSAERTLTNGFREITLMAEKLNLPKAIVDRAQGIFRQTHDTKQLRTRSTDALSAACLHIACRQEGVGRTFKEIVAVCRVSKRDLGRVFTQILRILETSVETITSGDFMIRFCSHLSLSSSVRKTAQHIAKRTVELGVCDGRSPVSIAAASIYLASQSSSEKKSAAEIGEIAGAAVSTILQSYKKMHPRLHDLFPEDYKFVTPIASIPDPR